MECQTGIQGSVDSVVLTLSSEVRHGHFSSPPFYSTIVVSFPKSFFPVISYYYYYEYHIILSYHNSYHIKSI